MIRSIKPAFDFDFDLDRKHATYLRRREGPAQEEREGFAALGLGQPKGAHAWAEYWGGAGWHV